MSNLQEDEAWIDGWLNNIGVNGIDDKNVVGRAEAKAAILAKIKEAKYIGGKVCACELAEPCMEQCTCARMYMSGGCNRCATYGNYGQSIAAAMRIAQLREDK